MPMSKTRLVVLGGLLLVGGCLWPVQQQTDATLADLASHPFDLAGNSAEPIGPSQVEQPAKDKTETLGTPPGNVLSALPKPDVQTTALMAEPTKKTLSAVAQKRRLEIPPEIPAADVPRRELPKSREERAKI